MTANWTRIGNGLLAIFAGFSAFVLTMLGFLLLGRIDQQIVASVFIGLFALLVVRIATERPNTRQARAVSALIDRLLGVGRGDLTSPAPAVLRQEMPALAGAVDGLFDQVRTSLDNFQTLAMYDPVTTLPNRIHFRKEAERILEARQSEQRPALLFIDLDGFKEVNDRLGHAQGDQTLVMVANRLRVVLRAETEPGTLSQPLLARLAGDEFTILLPDAGSREEAERIAGRALEALSAPFRGPGQASTMGASIGVALCPDHGGDLTSLMKAADVAMYHAKESGRSRVCFYHPDLARASIERATLASGLAAAIGKGQLELVYRAQLCLRTGVVVAGEAQAVWNRPGAQPLPLDEVADLIEEIDLADSIGEWMVDAAASARARWRDAGLDLRLVLKLPSGQLARSDFSDRLAPSLGGDPAALPIELELDQGQLSGAPATRARLDALRRLGVCVAVVLGAAGVDFEALAACRADRVKLARALVAEVDLSERGRLVVATLIHLLHELGCEAVAGPVDRHEQLEVLRAIGCDIAEGFAGVEPMGEAAFLEWALQAGPPTLALPAVQIG